MRYPGHYLLSYISYWLHCLSSLHVRALPLRLDSLHRLFLPPVGCLLRSASVSPTCTLPRVRRPRLCRSRWRLNSHGMQSASLYNYASITCSVHALISHFKSMTRTYQGFFKERSRFAAHAGSPPPAYLQQAWKAQWGLPLWDVWEKPPGCKEAGGGNSLTHGRNAGISRHPMRKRPQVLTDPDSIVWRLKEVACCIGCDRIRRRGRCHGWLKGCWFIKGRLCRFNEGGEDWKWHSINRNCQTIKQCKQHRWTSDESRCRKPFSEAAAK